mgnify:CR=1 FL=1|jgi:RimJ/RimL family protein N-acetyltransferase
MNDKKITIVGKRVNLTTLRKNDLKIVQKWRNSNEIWPYSTQYILLNMNNQKQWYEENFRKKSNRVMLIITNKIGNTIGICGLVNINSKDKSASIAISIGEVKYQNKGLGKEILELLINYAFVKLKLHKIDAEVFAYNHNSKTLFEKMNFKQEAIMRDCLWRYNKWWNIYKFSLVKN